MAISSGSQGLVRMMAGWCVVIAVGAVIILRTDDVLDVLGLPKKSDAANSEQPAARAASVQPVKADRTVVIRASGNGHYEVTARINGRPIDVMVDTGATAVALTFEDARAAGIFPSQADYTVRVNTANGQARVAPVTIDQITIDDVTVRNVRGFVAERGAMTTTLLGMSFLSRLTRSEMSRGVLTLQE